MKKYFNLIIILLTAATWIQCGEPDYPEPKPSINTLSSKLTVIHAQPGGPRLKIKIDNKITEKDTVRYDTATNDKLYNAITLTIPAGPTRLINYAKLADNVDVVVDRYAATAATNNTSFFINTTSGTSQKVRRVVDDLALPDVGFAKLRFLHFAYRTAEVKVVNTANASTTFSARNYDEVSRGSGSAAVDFTRFTSMAAGTYNFEVRLTSNDSVLVAIPNLKLDSKGIYTIYARGDFKGTGANALGYGLFKH